MLRDEVLYVPAEGKPAHTEVVGFDSSLQLELIAAFEDSEMSGAKGDDSELGIDAIFYDRPRHLLTRVFIFPGQPVHQPYIILGTFRVFCLLVMPASSCKVSCRRMIRSRQGAVRNPIVVSVLIAGELAQIF